MRAAALVAAAALAVGAAGCEDRPAHAQSPCPRGAGAELERATGGRPARVVVAERAPGLLTCDYRAGATGARVTIDTLPQAAQRYNRGLVETWQNTAGWAQRPARRPRIIAGVGAAAYWVPANRELFATAGGRLVRVSARGPAALPIARRMARAVLPRAGARRSRGS